MKVDSKVFGLLSSGEEVHLYTLEAGDLSLSITDFGASWTSLFVPSKKNGREDILLGFSTLESYIHNSPSFGSTVGRFANRIGGAAFALNGKNYSLYKNDGNNTLHGGRRGFSRLLWKAEPFTEKDRVFVRFELESPDGDEGYPGNLKAAATYGIDGNEISALYEAKVDVPCPVNFTNHMYFNLSGEGNGDILSHEVKIFASSYVEPDKNLIPTGKLLPVEGTPFDFRKAKSVSKDFAAVCGGDVSAVGTGYDHCFAIDSYDGAKSALRPCAEVHDGKSGRYLAVSTSQPGVQFYTGNFLTGIPGKSGSVYGKNAGFCLETQHFPDSPNRPEFPPAIFGP
jgi:aldose 1-epimerase